MALTLPVGHSHTDVGPAREQLQTALDENMQIVPGGIVEQLRQAFGNVLTTLREASGIAEDLVSITIYLTDIPDYQAYGKEIGEVWRELAGPVYRRWPGSGPPSCGSRRR